MRALCDFLRLQPELFLFFFFLSFAVITSQSCSQTLAPVWLKCHTGKQIIQTVCLLTRTFNSEGFSSSVNKCESGSGSTQQQCDCQRGLCISHFMIKLCNGIFNILMTCVITGVGKNNTIRLVRVKMKVTEEKCLERQSVQQFILQS